MTFIHDWWTLLLLSLVLLCGCAPLGHYVHPNSLHLDLALSQSGRTQWAVVRDWGGLGWRWTLTAWASSIIWEGRTKWKWHNTPFKVILVCFSLSERPYEQDQQHIKAIREVMITSCPTWGQAVGTDGSFRVLGSNVKILALLFWQWHVGRWWLLCFSTYRVEDKSRDTAAHASLFLYLQEMENR